MKFVDYKCPNCGGSVKFEKGTSSGFCENCGATLHVETETTDKLFRAFDLISVNRFVAATQLINEVLSVDVKNGQAYLGLLLCDTECSSPICLSTTKYSFINNPNYIRALDFLSTEQKNELIALCNQNPANNHSKSTQPTETMQELSRLNGTIIANGFTAVQLYYGSDFSTADENVVIQFFHETTEHMDKMISLYNALNDEQKKRIPNFSIVEFEGAVDTYYQIKEIIASLPKNDLSTNADDDCSDFESQILEETMSETTSCAERKTETSPEEISNTDISDDGNTVTSQSVEEILNDSTLSPEEKIKALSVYNGIDCIQLLLNKAYNLNWFFRDIISKEQCEQIYGKNVWDDWFTYIEDWDQSLEEFMVDDLPRLDACSQLIGEMFNDDPNLEENGQYILWKIAAHIWVNRPYAFYEGHCASYNEYEDLKNVREQYFELYKYIAKLYVLEEQYLETCGGNHAVNLEEQFEMIRKLKQAIFGMDSFAENPYRFYQNKDLGYIAMDEILTAELEYIESFIKLDCEKSILEYELGGLGLFNPTRKKEIKTRLSEIENILSNRFYNVKIVILNNKKQYATVSLYNLQFEKDSVDKAKAAFDTTPFTAFARRKELKQKYQSINERYLAKKTAYEEQIKALTAEIEKIQKNIK